MYELKKIGKIFRSKFVGTGPSPYEKRIYRAAVPQSLRNTDICNKIHILSPFLLHVSAFIAPSSRRTFLRTLKTSVTFCNRLETFTKLLTKTRSFHRES